MKRLQATSGEIAENSPRDTDAPDRVTRQAILVHGGADGSSMEFMSGDGEISFDAARIQRVVDNQNEKINALAAQYGGIEKMPAGAFPPVLDQHENDSNNRVVGRMTGLLRYEVRDVPKVGKQVPCAVAEVTFLGKDTVDRVKDGRIYHLSIGIDEESDTLGEVSTVITPAAPGAMLLSAAKNTPTKGGKKMSNKAKRMKASADRMSKLTAIKESIEGQKKKLVVAQEGVKLAAKKSEVSHRLTGLMRSGKLSPAEYKKLDLTKMAGMDASSSEMLFSTLEAREPVIMAGQRGSSDSAEFGQLAKDLEKRQMKRMAAEIKGDFKKLGAKMAFGEDEKSDPKHDMSGPHEEAIHPGKDPHAVEGEMHPEVAHLAHHLAAMKSHLDSGDMEKAKEVHAAMEASCAKMGSMKHMEMGDVKSEDAHKSMEAMQGQVDELSTQLARMAGMVSELMEVEKEEGHDLASEEDEGHEAAKKELEEQAGKHVPPAKGAGELKK